jgi:DNA-binding transcriptional LysR family regulator
MDFRRLEHFLAVLEHGRFNLAAEANNVSQQAVSQAISKLEKELGVVLFERHPLGATPTMYAIALRERARTILVEAKLATTELAALNPDSRQSISIGVGANLVGRIMARTVREFRLRRPGFALRVTVDLSSSLYSQLLRGDLDLVASAPLNYENVPPELSVERLFDEVERVTVRTTHPLAALSNPTMRDLRGFPWVCWAVPKAPDVLWRRVCQGFTDHGEAPPSDVIRTDSSALVQCLLLSDDYVGILGREALVQTAGLATPLEIAGLRFSHPVLLSYRTRSVRTGAEADLIAILQQNCREWAPPL